MRVYEGLLGFIRVYEGSSRVYEGLVGFIKVY